MRPSESTVKLGYIRGVVLDDPVAVKVSLQPPGCPVSGTDSQLPPSASNIGVIATDLCRLT